MFGKKGDGNKTSTTINTHIMFPSGVVKEHDVKEHNRFVFDSGVYDVRSIFTLPSGRRMMLVSKGNPVPHPDNGVNSSEAMAGQYLSATIDDLSRPEGPGVGDLIDRIIAKISKIPPWVFVGLIVLLVLISQGVIG